MIKSCINLIETAKKIAIFTHVNPDGDALGSSIALKLGLESLNKQVDVYCDDIIHENYFFLGTQEYYVEHKNTNYDLAIVVDCSELSRIGSYSTLFHTIPTKIVIDHHLNNKFDNLVNAQFIDSSAESSATLVYRLFEEMNIPLDKEIASSIYAGVSSDTGCFMHSNTTQESHFIVGKLMEYDIDLETINYYLFKRKTKGQITLFAEVLGSLQFHENNQIAMAVITQEMFKKTGTNNEDTVGISSYISGIENIELAVLLTETKDNCFKASLRSKNINANVIAQAFQGGGNKQAAGFRVCGKVENITNKILEVTKKELMV